jgi:hypothetical protein
MTIAMDLITKINLFFMLYAALLVTGMIILLFLFIQLTWRTQVQPTVPQPLCFDNGSSIFPHDIELSTLPYTSTRPPSHARETTTSPYHKQTPPDYAPPLAVNCLDTPWCMWTIRHDSYWTAPGTSVILAEEDFIGSCNRSFQPYRQANVMIFFIWLLDMIDIYDTIDMHSSYSLDTPTYCDQTQVAQV